MAVKSGLRFSMVGAVFVVAMSTSAALACKGPTTLFRDDFTDEDPAWALDHSIGQIADGAMKVTTKPQTYFDPYYQGMNFPAGDACIDIVSPSTPSKTPTQAGLGLWTSRGWNFIYIASDGTAGVTGLQDNNWVNPVPARKFDGIKLTPGADNQLRVVWSAPPAQNATTPPDQYVQIFINDKLFIKYKTPPNADRAIAIYADTEGATYEFKNLVITNPTGSATGG